MSAHVKIKGLTITYRDDDGNEMVAVREATIQLARGETLGVVGESGSGKSTLARALLAHTRPGARFAAGTVHLGGTDVLALKDAALRRYRGGRAAMVPQNPLSSLTPHMTIGAQLEELVRLHTDLTGKTVREHALSLMERTGLPEPEMLAKRYPHEISGGQRQRVVIAAALVSKPELIVLDEPTTALDKTVEAKVLQMVADVQKELGATLIYVSHDLNVIRALCSRIVVMKDGIVIEQGDADRVFRAPKNEYTKSLIKAIPQIDVEGPFPPEANSCDQLLVKDLRFFYHRPSGWPFLRPAETRPTLDGLSFSLKKGETLGLVGESGSGKSTVASLIAGAVSGHQGLITLDGDTISGAAKKRSRGMRRRIQMVFQDPLSSLNPAHTIEEILVRPLRHHFGLTPSAARDKAVEALRDMELGPEFLSRRPRQLSGGQQQRVGFARALAAEPDLLICDEVTSALDVTIQSNMLALFLRIQRERAMTCIFISHDLAVIARVSHRIAVLEKGQLREIGDRDTVLHHPASDYTRRLLAAASCHVPDGNQAAGFPRSLSA